MSALIKSWQVNVSYDVCKRLLVRSLNLGYLQSKLTPIVGNDIGLYRDDGLGALKKTPREIENIKKYICQTFNEHNLKLTIEANKKTVNFLDVTLDLNSSTYKPYTKPGNVIQ